MLCNASLFATDLAREGQEGRRQRKNRVLQKIDRYRKGVGIIKKAVPVPGRKIKKGERGARAGAAALCCTRWRHCLRESKDHYVNLVS